jgi:F0F1-type ATP synthase membrane subunit b/b'
MESNKSTEVVSETSRTPHQGGNWIGWTIQVITLVIVALVGYNLSSTKSSMNDHITQLQDQISNLRSEADAKAADVATRLDSISESSGLTARELDVSKKNAEKLRQDQEKSKKALTKEVADARAESANGISQIQQTTESKFGEVTGQVNTVSSNLDSTRQDLTRIHQDLTQQIAKNSTELADLRKKGDRDYVEFVIHKTKKNELQRVADIQMAVTGTDPKRQKYDVVVLVDDHKMERKDRVANEPLQFLVGREQLRYEVVVNYVDKDQIRGYISTPKDKTGAERSAALKTP